MSLVISLKEAYYKESVEKLKGKIHSDDQEIKLLND